MKAALTQSSTASISALDVNSIVLNGALDFYTVPVLMKQAERLLAQSSDASVDFSAVASANSAGLVLILEMLRFMRARNAVIQFKNIPEQITIVARAYGIDTALDSTEFVNQASV